MATGTALTQTTLSAALAVNQNTFGVASATNLSNPVGNFYQKIYVIGPGQAKGELMTVIAVSGTQITVSRLDEFKAFWPSGSVVLIGPIPISTQLYGYPAPGGGFQEYDPPGASATQQTSTAASVQYSPWVNIVTGKQWIWSTVLNCWVPGWQNSEPPSVSDAVASAAAAITPSGPLFHVTGALAITGITRPIGFAHGSFTMIPDHAAASFTWTTGDGSIAVAGTAIQFRAVTFTFDPSGNAGAGIWYPSYV